VLIEVSSLRNIIFALFLLRHARTLLLHLRGHGILGSLTLLYKSTHRTLYGYFLRLPGVRSKVAAQVAEALAGMEKKLVPSGPGVVHHTKLPAQGWSTEDVHAELVKLRDMEHTKWEEGYVSGAVYHGGEEMAKLQTEAFGMFTVSNPIHPDVFPGVRKMEAEVVSMVVGMFGGAGIGACGVSTSGGTESILMAVLSAKNKAYAERGVRKPEL
jgi:sphinganine-1-phosphate aldolase